MPIFMLFFGFLQLYSASP